MHIFQDKDAKYFVLLPEVWKHIIEGHPEIEKHLNDIGRTLADPFAIFKSRHVPDRRLYYRRFRKKLFFVTVVDINKGIIKTSYITDRIKKGELVWQAEK
jgi:hypothetical protein